MAMSKKDYALIAAVIASASVSAHLCNSTVSEVIKLLTFDLAKEFEKVNVKFKSEVFIKACMLNK